MNIGGIAVRFITARRDEFHHSPDKAKARGDCVIFVTNLSDTPRYVHPATLI